MNRQTFTILSALLFACAAHAEEPESPQAKAGANEAQIVTVKLANAAQANTAKLTCADGSFESSQSLSAGVAKFEGVPDGSCTLKFTGEVTATFTPVVRGQSYKCSIIGETAVCK